MGKIRKQNKTSKSSSLKKSRGSSSLTIKKKRSKDAKSIEETDHSKKRLKISSNLSYEEKCSEIAILSEEILENPEQCVRKPKQTQTNNIISCSESKLRQLLNYANVFQSSAQDLQEESLALARLALISLLAVFQDILPSYRIRLPTQEELSTKLKKTTKELWDFERELLSNYQQYLKLLERTFREYSYGNLSQAQSQLSLTAIMTACELFKKTHYFNFRNNLLQLIIPQMNSNLDIISATCTETIKTLFKVDKQGEITLEAVKLISSLIQEKKSAIKPQVLQVFLSLPLQVQREDVLAAQLLRKQEKILQKQNNEQFQIRKEMKEADASIDLKLKAQMQNETLHTITICYFRIVKSFQKKEYKGLKKLLPYALEGLAHFAFLIHLDTLLDLIHLIQDLLLEEELSLYATCQCILTANEAFSNKQVRELDLDLKEFLQPLYEELKRMILPSNAHAIPSMLRCMQVSFISRKEYSIPRIMAFIKRLFTMSLVSTNSLSAIPLLSTVYQLLQKYSSTSSTQLASSFEQFLENESDKVCFTNLVLGSYFDDTNPDPETCAVSTTSAWEISLLNFHFDPRVSKKMSWVLSCSSTGSDAFLAKEDALEVYSDLKLEKDLACICSDKIYGSKKHVLKNLVQKDGKKKDQKVERFVRPKYKGKRMVNAIFDPAHSSLWMH